MDDYPTQEALDDYYTSTIFFDPLDIKILRESMNNAEYMYAYSFEPLGDRLDRIFNNVLDGRCTPHQGIDQYIDAANEVIVDIVVPNKTGLDSYFAD